MSCTGDNRKCNDNPIIICTSLPPSEKDETFDDECRELAEAMCKAVVRTIEQYRVLKNTAGNPTFPKELKKWVVWANDQANGLPDCLDPDTPSSEFGQSMQVDVSATPPALLPFSKQTNRTYNAVHALGAELMTLDIDDWHDW